MAKTKTTRPFAQRDAECHVVCVSCGTPLVGEGDCPRRDCLRREEGKRKDLASWLAYRPPPHTWLTLWEMRYRPNGVRVPDARVARSKLVDARRKLMEVDAALSPFATLAINPDVVNWYMAAIRCARLFLARAEAISSSFRCRAARDVLAELIVRANWAEEAATAALHIIRLYR